MAGLYGTHLDLAAAVTLVSESCRDRHPGWDPATIGSCGGINPYTLTARLGPGDLAHHETVQGLIQLLGSFTQGNKTWRSSHILVG